MNKLNLIFNSQDERARSYLNDLKELAREHNSLISVNDWTIQLTSDILLNFISTSLLDGKLYLRFINRDTGKTLLSIPMDAIFTVTSLL